MGQDEEMSRFAVGDGGLVGGCGFWDQGWTEKLNHGGKCTRMGGENGATVDFADDADREGEMDWMRRSAKKRKVRKIGSERSGVRLCLEL
jgi:hypothetical protein